MRNRLIITPYILFLGGLILNIGVGWPSTAEPVLTVSDESIVGAPPPPTAVKEDRVWHLPKGLGWENRFFDKPLSQYHFPKSQIRLPNGPGIPIKSPGILPGIEFGVEMHSFQALQSVVPPERLSKPFSFQQNQHLFLSPSNISPDYNAGFLRLTW